MKSAAYADRRRAAKARALYPPRNARAADVARERGVALVASFVGDTPWQAPTVYCDSGKSYDWESARGLHVIIAVKPGIDARNAMREILQRADTIKTGYPMLVDVERQEVACIVDGVSAQQPIQLWHVQRGTELWQQFFEPST